GAATVGVTVPGSGGRYFACCSSRYQAPSDASHHQDPSDACRQPRFAALPWPTLTAPPPAVDGGQDNSKRDGSLEEAGDAQRCLSAERGDVAGGVIQRTDRGRVRAR